MDLSTYLFTDTHEWVKLAEGYAFVGVSVQAVEEIGFVESVSLPTVGRKVKVMDEIALIDATNAAFTVSSPVAGVIVRVNEDLAVNPSLLHQACYEEGWIAVIEPSYPMETGHLMTFADYQLYLSGVK